MIAFHSHDPDCWKQLGVYSLGKSNLLNQASVQLLYHWLHVPVFSRKAQITNHSRWKSPINQLMLKRIWHSTINNINENCSLLRLNITIPKLTGRESISALLKHDIPDHLGLALPSINTLLPNTTLAYSRGYFCSLNLVSVYSYHQANPSASDPKESRLHTIVHNTLVHGWRSYHRSVALQCLIWSQILLKFPIFFAYWIPKLSINNKEFPSWCPHFVPKQNKRELWHQHPVLEQLFCIWLFTHSQY